LKTDGILRHHKYVISGVLPFYVHLPDLRP
jgi:hypothetical protein